MKFGGNLRKVEAPQRSGLEKSCPEGGQACTQKTDTALQQEFRPQLAQAICNLAAAMDPLID